MSEEKKFGDIEFSGKDFLTPNIQFDRIAINGRGELLFVSIVSDQARVKQIRAILSPGVKCNIAAGGVRVRRASAEPWDNRSLGRIYPSAEGYQTYTQKLGYSMIHAMFITRSHGFLNVVTEESLWQELKGARFTTPLLREWMPFIDERLRADQRLEDADCFNCQCGILTATTKKLDEIVSEGLQQRLISIPE
jgi:hypothetical protein